MSLIRTVAPATALLSVSDCKLQLRITDSDSDAELEGFIKVAESYLNGSEGGILNRALITQTWVWKIDAFPTAAAILLLPLPPLQSITSIAYVDSDGADQTVSDFRTFGVGARFGGGALPAYGATWPATRAQPEAVTVTFVAGYGDEPSDVPDDIRQAALLHVEALYDNRGYEQRGGQTAGFPTAAQSYARRHVFRPIS